MFEVYPATTGDLPFVLDSWVHSFARDAVKMNRPRIRARIFLDEHRKLASHIISRSSVWVSRNPDDEEQIAGYLVCEYQEKPVLHYCYVKEAFRLLGVAKSLVAKVGVNEHRGAWASHWNRRLKRIEAVDRLNIQYNPYRRYLLEEE